MSLSLWGQYDPWQEMRRLQREMDQMFSHALTTNTGNNTMEWSPAMDIKETDKEIVIHQDLPGVKKEDIKVELHDGILTISGERKSEIKEEKDKYYRVERSFGKFSRSIAVPKDLKEDQIKAQVNNGVLEISFPKAKEEPKPKTIKIN
jgi:HSP20 family protein